MADININTNSTLSTVWGVMKMLWYSVVGYDD